MTFPNSEYNIDRVPRERLWNANYNKVMLTNFTLFFAFYLITPLLPLYLSETYHATKDTIGMALSGYTLLALVSRLFSGYLVDTYPRKKVLLVATALYAICFGSYLVAGTLLSFTLLRTIHGAPFGTSTVANSTVAIDVLPSSRRSEGIGYYGISNNLGSALGPTVGLTIYQQTHSFQLLFWLALSIAVVGFISSAMVHPRQPERAVTEPRKQPISLDRFFLLRGWYIALNICTFGFCWGLMSNYLAIYGKEHLGTAQTTGTWFLVLSCGLIASRMFGQKAIRSGRLLESALQGVAFSTVGYILFISIPSTVTYFLSAVLIGLGNGRLWPAFQNMIIQIASANERGTANSTILTSWDLGMGAGILLGGIVAESMGYDAAFWMMAGMHVVGFLVYVFVTKRRYTAAL